jgi:hypothetical protein
MGQVSGASYIFRLNRTQYTRISQLAWLFIAASLILAATSITLGVLFWPTYIHRFTFYLKWQDALVASLWYVGFVMVWGGILVTRFLFALRAGYRDGMLLLREDGITLRDLSSKNLKTICWMVGTALACFLAALVGLAPDILIGWTIHLPNPALVFFCTAAAALLTLAGLTVTLVSGSFIIIGLIGSYSFSRNMGAPHTYQLAAQTTIRVDGQNLAVIYPDRPESLFDLDLLDPEDRQRLLYLLRKRWLAAKRPERFRLTGEIEAALEEIFQGDGQHRPYPIQNVDKTGIPIG